MPQCVRTRARAESSSNDIFLDQDPQHFPSESPAATTHKNPGRIPGFQELWTSVTKVCANRRARRPIERHDSLLTAFAYALAKCTFDIEVRHSQIDHFRCSTPCRIERLEQGPIPEVEAIGRVRGRQKFLHRLGR